MARATDTAGDSRGLAFSRDAVDELRGVLGDAVDTILPQLQDVLDRHLRFLAIYHAPKSVRKPGADRDVKRIVESLQTLIARIDDLKPHTKARLEERPTLYDLAVPNSAWEDLTTLRAQAQQTLRRLVRRTTGHVPPKRPRGRPEKPERRSLTDYVALILRINGIRVTSARGGDFDMVLSTVLTEAEGKAPIDVFRLIGPASKALKAFTDEECHQAARGLKLPEWA